MWKAELLNQKKLPEYLGNILIPTAIGKAHEIWEIANE